MKRKITLILLILSINIYSQNNNTYFIGHSLVGHTIPRMLDQMAVATNINYVSSRQVINGAPLKYNWENPHLGEIGNYENDLTTGIYSNLVLTEAVPLKNHLTWSDTYKISNNFYNYFSNYRTNGKVYIYETWHCINSGTSKGCSYDNEDHINWRQRLDEDLDDWESITNHLNDLQPNNQVLLIPGGQAMAKLHDAITNNEILGVDSIDYFFIDDIHLNDIGSYYMACVMYTTLFKKSPKGLPINFTDIWGVPYQSPSEALATKLQELSLEVVCSYPKSGVDCSTLGISNVKNKKNLLITQNNHKVIIELKQGTMINLKVYDLLGKTIISKKLNNQKIYSFNTDKFSNLVYIVSIETSNGKIVQKKVLFK